MKKSKIIVILIVIMIMASSMLLFSSCKDKIQNKESITITFVTNDPIIEIEPIIVTKDKESYMPVNPVKAGSTFLGWYYNKECTSMFSPDDELYNDITLYAKWKDNIEHNTEINPPDYVESGSFSYFATNDYYVIMGYKGNDSEIVIPDSYNQKPVVEIAEFAFKDNDVIEKITIGSVLQQINEGAFENCKNLKEITVKGGSDYFSSNDGILYNRDKNSIFQIGMAKEIDSFEIAKNVNIIRKGAFFGTDFDVTFEEDGEYNHIQEYDFYGFEGKLNLNSNIIAIDENGLNGCKGQIVFEESNTITTIGLGAFDNFSGEKVILPTRINEISEFAFNNCSAEIDISKTSITEIGTNVFANYTGETLVVPSSVTNINQNAFYKSTTNITFDKGSELNKLGYLSFAMFMGTARLPSSVNTVENNAFWQMKPQAEIYFSLDRNQISVDEDYESVFNSMENIFFND